MNDYEKLGQFYLGKEYDLESSQVGDDMLLYDSKDLVTHGVVLGMTGSGNPLFPFPDRLSSVFSSLGEKANS